MSPLGLGLRLQDILNLRRFDLLTALLLEAEVKRLPNFDCNPCSTKVKICKCIYVSIYIYIYIFIYSLYICIYIYTERERGLNDHNINVTYLGGILEEYKTTGLEGTKDYHTGTD